MVVLVRCNNNTCTVAMESQLDDLIEEGLIDAYLYGGRWISVRSSATTREFTPIRTNDRRTSPFVSHL